MPEILGRDYRVDPAAFATAFVHALRAGGLGIGPDRAAWFVEALRLVPPTGRAELYWSARTVFVTSQSALPAFDRVFAAVFDGDADWADYRGDEPSQDLDAVRRRSSGSDRAPEPPDQGAPRGAAAPRAAGSGDDGAESGSDETMMLAASRDERLHTTAFSSLSEDELADIRRLVAALAVDPPLRPARRTRVAPSGGRLDLRRTLRVSRRTGGEPIRLVGVAPTRRARPIVLLADVSASMEPYTRVFLSLMQGLVAAHRAEAFVFATRLTRITRQLATRDADRALALAASGAEDWASGTRIAEGIRAFIDGYGRRGLARGAVVVILSDGWSQDDPVEIATQMARLARLAHRVVWVNPRKAAAGFQPLAGGMAAALPHVDAFVSGHSYAALDDLVRAIADDQDFGRRKGTH